MKDIWMQVLRGLKSKGFPAACALMTYSLIFVHTDARVFWTDPLSYFQVGDFSYHFFITFLYGIHQYAIPLAAALPLGFVFCDDEQTGFSRLCMGRMSRPPYLLHRTLAATILAMLAVSLPTLINTIFLYFITQGSVPLEGWLEAAAAGTYGWRASKDYFYVIVLEQMLRQAISAATFALIAIGLSALWRSRAFVLIASFSVSILADHLLGRFLGQEYTLSFLQALPLSAAQDAAAYLPRQAVVLAAAAAFCGACLVWRYLPWLERWRQRISPGPLPGHIFPAVPLLIPRPLRGTWLGRLAVDIRANLSVATLLPAAVIAAISLAMGFVVYRPAFTLGEALLDVFGGAAWVMPRVEFAAVGRWLLILLPATMGNAINVQREIGSRCLICLYRGRGWWLSKCLAAAAYALISTLVMFICVTLAALLAGGRELSVYMENEDGFITASASVTPLLLVLFAGHLVMLSQLQALIHFTFKSSNAGMIAVILPVIVTMLLYSGIYRPNPNLYIPFNWGMILRSELFSPLTETVGSETYPLCALAMPGVLFWQGALTALLFSLSAAAAGLIRHAQRAF